LYFTFKISLKCPPEVCFFAQIYVNPAEWAYQ